ncbi:hypothetical protein GGR58DRAFT_514705 [Xylaria digitata]|nr:hypothetical protein GGR58DRAFT_514705 [Xylaria digitata]
MPPKPRTRLQSDIQAASHEAIPHIERIGKGDVQDEFVFVFVHPQVPRGEIEIRVMPQDTAGYPAENYYLVYTNDEAPPKIGKVLDEAMASTTGMLIIDLLRALGRRLCDSLEPRERNEDGSDDNDVVMTDAEEDTEEGADEYANFPGFSDDDDSDTEVPFEFGDDIDWDSIPGPQFSARIGIHDNVLRRIRQDFRAVRIAGFRVGKICGVDQRSEYSIVTMSIKARKLGLSKETHTAWNMGSSDYIVLLMKYHGEYESFEDALKRPAGQTPLEFRLRKCSRYRPTLTEAMAAFSSKFRQTHYSGQSAQNSGSGESASGGLSSFSVGGSIDLLLDSGFINMMKLRKMENVSWDHAKKLYSELTVTGFDNKSAGMSAFRVESANTPDTNLPPILMDDHLSSDGQKSLPLIAMQFSLRYLLKCTDYCMICHERTTVNFEALKPYVCGNPLCLFQYMSLGLGPSIDHEIVNQEYVVDLLISFCYASLDHNHATGQGPKLREFPLGLNLQVPCVRELAYEKSPSDITIYGFGILINPIKIDICCANGEARITDPSRVNDLGLTVGQWVVIHTQGNHGLDMSARLTGNIPVREIFHCARIEAKIGSTLSLQIASRYPVPVTLGEFEAIKLWDWDKSIYTAGHLVLCNQSLDDLENDSEKAFSLALLLSALPSVGDMRKYLNEDRSRQLATWNRIPPAAMKLLRWIIASNRSYIVQLNNHSTKDVKPSGVEDEISDRSLEMISGVDDWIQFRFAQGSPEKEALFLDALREVEKPNRTILAWHGSPIGNWHSIIREGLNYKVTAHGRAFGDGVYFSRSFEYSLHYSIRDPPRTERFIWPQSSLKITNAISLNELVNLPDKFKHSVSCYVVDTLHWIQCRYLFVRPKDPEIVPATEKKNRRRNKEVEFEQDPLYTIVGLNNAKGESKIQRIPSSQHPNPIQQRRGSSSFKLDEVGSDDTDDENIEDIDFLAFDDNVEPQVAKVEHNVNNAFPPTPTNQELQTDFRPGGLDFSGLPQLALPSYATPPAQQTIQRELCKLQKVQTTTPLHELGWYIDFDRIENMFQWIVELHSFDQSLPLARDMKDAGITSIVIEIRFLRGYPLTPPFVRVIKPRFLPFHVGGGGHVTGGGAMCMELLTNTGWSPVSSMESVLLQVRLAMSALEPAPARLESCSLGPFLGSRRNTSNEYTIHEAVDAYIRAATSHGWEVPPEVKEVTMQ